MKVLFVTSEAAPFVKTGGLGEVAGSLPQALKKLGVEVSVVLPKYGPISDDYRKRMVHVTSLTVSLAWRRQYCGIERLDYQGLPFYFLDNEYYFKRPGFYGYFDDAERFAFFSRAALEGLKIIAPAAQIVHVHDWQSALVPVFLRAFHPQCNAKTVLTIHNLKFQGVFTHWVLHNILGLGDEYYTADKLEYYGKVNYLKAGIVFSDLLTTVSKSYAEEIKYPFFGEGLDALIRSQEKKLHGILNGLDYNDYNPQTDQRIYVNYKNSLAQKQKNKLKLQEELGLPTKKEIPLLGMVTRLTAQKGLDLLIHILGELMEQNLQLVILGTGEQKYEQIFKEAVSAYPGKFRILLKFDEVLARRIYAGADLFLMPSLYEPCGLSQLIALRYGALPVVRETGGLKDTVFPYNEKTGEGNGFSFTNYNAHDFLFTINRALRYYQDKKLWSELIKKATAADYGWEKSARAYLHLYRGLCKKGR